MIQRARSMGTPEMIARVLCVLVCLLTLSFSTSAQTCNSVEVAKLLASDANFKDGFGFAVSIWGDTAVIGAWRDDTNGVDDGSAYVYRLDGTSWAQEAKLLANDGQTDDQFGYSVSISGHRAVIGAHHDNDNGHRSGSAYIFRFDGASWIQEAKLLASDGADLDQFGRSVSICGDVAVIGAHLGDGIGTDTGSAYVYRFDGTGWAQEAKLIAGDGAFNDEFGVSVSIWDDTAVIGARSNDENGIASGSAYVFRFAGTGWTQEAKLVAADGMSGDFFGWSVSVSGDAAVIGALNDDDNGFNSGSAYVYRFDGTGWAQEAKLTASDGAFNDQFGVSVWISGDRAVIGAVFDDDNGSDSGSAYVFGFDGTSWTQVAKLLASDGAAEDVFGNSVCISGDTAVIGAVFDDDNETDSGSAYVFDLHCSAPCYADCDSSGTLTILDYICFGDDFAAGGPYADCDNSGTLNILDYICFSDAYAAGCP